MLVNVHAAAFTVVKYLENQKYDDSDCQLGSILNPYNATLLPLLQSILLYNEVVKVVMQFKIDEISCK